MWIDVDERLPEVGRRVKVFGDHTPEGTGCPVSYRRHDPHPPHWFWCSAEWRGMSWVTHWWDDESSLSGAAS